MGVHRNTVSKWVNRDKKFGNVNRKVGSGRKLKTTEEEDKKFLCEIEDKNNTCTVRGLQQTASNNGIKISLATVHTRLHKYNITYKKPIYKPLLTEKHKIARLEWARQNENRNWKEVAFSDESSIWFEEKQGKWMIGDEKNIVATVKHPTKRHIWAFITYDGIGEACMFSGIMNSDFYIQIIDETFLPYVKNNPGVIFQQDNDPKHKSKKTMAWLNNNNITLLNWPSCSPDLNIIENVWSLLKRGINKRKPKNIDELEKYINEEWNKIDQQTIKNLFDGMPKRIAQVIERNGGITDY